MRFSWQCKSGNHTRSNSIANASSGQCNCNAAPNGRGGAFYASVSAIARSAAQAVAWMDDQTGMPSFSRNSGTTVKVGSWEHAIKSA